MKSAKTLNGVQERMKQLDNENKLIWCLVGLIFAANLIALFMLGADYTLNSDDLSYVRSGIYLAKNGVLTMHDEVPTAQIMPGAPALVALFYFVFGEGLALWVALKLLWITLGSLTGWFIYKSVRMFAPWWGAVIAVLPLLRADFLLVNNLMLTEAPYMFCFAALVYLTLKMAAANEFKYEIGWLIAFMAALMLRANILSFPFFAAGYLVLKKYDLKRLLKNTAVLLLVLTCFVVPWSVRNYQRFDAFIPFTYGIGDPLLLGTYQGRHAPLDETLDYEKNVDRVFEERYSRYYDENGEIPEEYVRFLALEERGIKAKYRIRVWMKEDPFNFILSLLVLKPMTMMFKGYFPNREIEWIPKGLEVLQYIDFMICVLAFASAWYLKKYRKELTFFAILYMGHVYIHVVSYASARYNHPLMTIRFIAIGVGVALFVEVIRKLRDKRKTA